MALRKEQVLLLLTLAFGAWVAKDYFAEVAYPSRYTFTKLEYQAAAVNPAPLAGAASTLLVRRDYCTEPSETQPLPPRELSFPPRAPLTLAALPLDLGPDFGHLWSVQVDGAVVEGVTLLTAEAAPAVAETTPAEEPPAPATDTYATKAKRAEQTYDRVYSNGALNPWYGVLEASAVDLYELERTGKFDGVTLRLRHFNVETQKLDVGAPMVFGGDKARIDKIVLANTLRNDITRRIKAVPEASPQARRELIEWLLDRAREAAWIYDEALRQAERYTQETGANLDGLRLQQRVLRVRGDLAGELALLEGVGGALRESAFRYEGLGWLKSQLGLGIEAEADLRRAVQLGASDARPHAALAEFLRRRGRSREALASARRCQETLGSIIDAAEKAALQRISAACHLAVGDVKSAAAVVAAIDNREAQPYLDGCVRYAAGDVAGALAAFRQAGGSADGGAAQLGQAACLLRSGQWQEAHDLFVRIADQDPLLRHRAYTGLALLFCRLGQYDTALAWADRALEADPSDAYGHYLRGGLLRRTGQLAAAAESLAAALRRHDDFVHTIAEMALLESAKQEDSSGIEQIEAGVAARRYSDRAVALAPEPSLELRQWQGLAAFRAADARAAREAFVAARELAVNDLDKNYVKGAIAVIDYSRGLVDDAEQALDRISQDVPRDQPLWAWAGKTLLAIQDHAQKEVLRDSFDRSLLGTTWRPDNDGQLGPKMVDGRLLLRDKFTAGEVTVLREGAVRHGKNFLATGVTMQLGAGHPAGEDFVGLGIELGRGSGGNDLIVRVGIREGAPYLRLEDGRDDGKQPPASGALTVPGFELAGRHEIELRVVPRGDEQSKQNTLLVAWNGEVVARHDLKQLTGNTSGELRTVLFATGSRNARVDVAFDDYRLERRKDRQ
ncbi:MAG: tetratricopeptide repeat protein [Planctomycetes bacterium]|nr:tetratricopeptide repeat protein [Planctomycetota bacterium]